MDSYEFAYFGRDIQSLEDTIASWCSERKCRLETTELDEGATFRISGLAVGLVVGPVVGPVVE